MNRLWSSLFLFVLCSKIYFILGFFPGTHLPAAPIWLIAIRDFSLALFFGFFLLQWNSHRKISDLKILKSNLMPVALLFILGVIVVAAQMMGPKLTRDVLQHYFRNGLISALVFPVGILMLHLRMGFPNLRKCLKIFMFINVLASYPQLYWNEYMWVNRPTGLLGDPLLSSAFILIGIWLLFQDRHEQNRIVTFGGMIFAIPIVYLSNSLSSLLAFGAAAIFVLGLEMRLQENRVQWLQQRLKKMIVAAVICLGIFTALALSLKDQNPQDLEHGVAAKAKLLYHSLFCVENCGPKEWFVEGRVKSNRIPFQLCSENPSQCLVGNWQNPDYARLDSLWASLMVNWGVFFLGIYLFVFLILPIKQIKKLRQIDQETSLPLFVFAFYWVFSLLNAGFYKYPLNLVFYLSLAMLVNRSRSSYKKFN